MVFGVNLYFSAVTWIVFVGAPSGIPRGALVFCAGAHPTTAPRRYIKARTDINLLIFC
jgi:hypothetical protein